MELSNQTEYQILEAAEKVFYIRGREGASMQDIAEMAGITRTSLNYYYRSKDKLFEEVFKQALMHFIPKIAGLLHSKRTMAEYLPELVEIFIDSIIERPQIPVFILQELTSNPLRVPEMISELGIHPQTAIRKMKEDPLLKGISVDPRQLIMNVLSMTVFPFAAKPMFVSVMFDGDEEEFISLMKERKKLIPGMIETMIKSLKK